MEVFTERVDNIRQYMASQKVKIHPISNPYLAEQEEYKKSLYFTMLCTLIQYHNTPTEFQNMYIKRLIIGTKCQQAMKGYIRNAMKIGQEEVKEFIDLYKEDKLRFYFCIDAMIILSEKQEMDKPIELLSEIVELLEIKLPELQYLSLVARSIIEQSSKQFDESKKKMVEAVKGLEFRFYLKNFYVGAIIDNEDQIYYCSPDRAEIDLGGKYTFKQRIVIFENLTIHVKNEWKFLGCEEVKFINCELIGAGFRLDFTSVGLVKLNDSKVSKFNSGFIWGNNINKFKLCNNYIFECAYNGDGSVAHINGNIELIEMIGNQFINCDQKDRLGRGIIIFSSPVRALVVKNNNFIGNTSDTKNASLIYTLGDIINKCIESNVCSGAFSKII